MKHAAIALALLATAPAAAGDEKDVMTPVNQFVDGLNKGDTGWRITGWSWAKN